MKKNFHAKNVFLDSLERSALFDQEKKSDVNVQLKKVHYYIALDISVIGFSTRAPQIENWCK